MDDIDIEPPEAPVISPPPKDEVPIPPPGLQVKKGLFSRLLPRKKESPQKDALPGPGMPALPPSVDSMPGQEGQAPAIPPSADSLPGTPSPAPPAAQEDFQWNMPVSEPPHEEEELLPPPKLDEFYSAHAEAIEDLKKKLGVDEIAVPQEDKQEDNDGGIEVELHESPIAPTQAPPEKREREGILRALFRKRQKEEPARPATIAELVKIPEQKDAAPEFPVGPFVIDLEGQPPAAPAMREPDSEWLRDVDETPAAAPRPVQDTSAATQGVIFGMSGTMRKGERPKIEKIETAPFRKFYEKGKELQEIPELPAPVQEKVPASSLSNEEIREIVDGIQDYRRFSEATDNYLAMLELELKEVIKAPYALRGKKRIRKSPKETSLFFAYHTPASLASVIKLLKTIEFVYKVDLDAIAVSSGKDIESYLKRFVESERNKEDAKTLEKELELIMNAAFVVLKGKVEKEKREIAASLARQVKEKGDLERREESLRKRESGMRAVIDQKIAAVREPVEKQAAIQKKEHELRIAKLKREREDFDRLRKKQDLDIYSEIQRVEALKKKVEGEAFELEEEKEEFEEQRKDFKTEQRKILDSMRQETAGLRAESRDLQKKIVRDRARMEREEKEYDDRIKNEYFQMSEKIGKEAKEFNDMREKEEARIESVRSSLRQEKEDVLALKEELDRQEAKLMAILSEQKTQIRKDIDEIRNIDQNLEQVEINIRRQKEALETDGFERYLQSRLRDVNPSALEGVAIPHDLVEEHEIEKALYKEIYDLIEECRTLISQDRIEEARDKYNRIREMFASSELTVNEKSILFNMIRELYDDIHLLGLKES